MTRVKLVYTNGETLTLLIELPPTGSHILTMAGRVFQRYHEEPQTYAQVCGKPVENGPLVVYRETESVAVESLVFNLGA